MTSRSIQLTDEVYQYLKDVSLREHPVLAELRDKTAKMTQGNMQISPDQGQFMSMLIKLTGAKRTIEVGVFTGYSSSIVAMALPDDGQLVACDSNAEWTKLAKETWKALGLENKITFHLAPALETLQQLIDQGETGKFDFAFIDADKVNYQHYYEHCLKLVRAGGLIAIDNTLWYGKLIDPAEQDDSTNALRELNQFLHQDKRVDICIVPIGDGLTLLRKLDY